MTKLERRTMNTTKDVVHALELTYVREEFLKKILWDPSYFFSQSYARERLPVIKKERGT